MHYRDKIDTVTVGETQLTWVPPKPNIERNPEPALIFSNRLGYAVDVYGIQDIVKLHLELTRMIKKFGAGESG
jgi:hypothetical protein